MDAKKFGAFIAEVRKEKNMTQAALAEKLQVTDKAVSRWERGLGFPDIGTLEPLAAALDLSILELMRSERAGETPPSGESVSQALSDTLALARREDALREGTRNGTLAVIAIGLLLAALMFWQVGSVTANVIFFAAYLGAMICAHYLSDAKDKKAKTIFTMSLVAAVSAAMISARYLMPELAARQYEKWSILAIAVYNLTTVINAILSLVLNAKKKKKFRMIAAGVYSVAVLAFIFTGVGRDIRNISDSEEKQRSNAVSQYAEALLQAEEGVQSSDISGRFVTYAAEEDAEPDGCTVVFTYRLPGEAADRAYGYSISIDRDMHFTVTERGETLGEAYVSTVEETSPVTQETD